MTIASAAAMLNLFNGLWLDGELYNFHRWFDMIYILIMHLGCVFFILWLKSEVLLGSEVGMIMVSICLHGVIPGGGTPSVKLVGRLRGFDPPFSRHWEKI